MYLESSSGIVRSASAVDRCLCSSLTSSSSYAGLRAAAMSVALMRQSVTLGSPLVATPMAETTPNVLTPDLADSMRRSHTPEMRSKEPTHVPPNLCTSCPDPRSTPPELDGAEAGSATAARTGAARSGDALTTFTTFLSALRPANGDRRDPAYIAGWATEVDIAAIGDFRSVFHSCGSSRGGSHRACKLRVTMCASATCTSRTTREGVIDVRSLFRGWEDTGGRGVPFGVAGGPARLTERPIHETRFFGGNSAAFLYAKQHVCSYMTRLTMINELRTRN